MLPEEQNCLNDDPNMKNIRKQRLENYLKGLGGVTTSFKD